MFGVGSSLWLTFSFYVFFEQQVLTIEDGIGELPDPIAQDEHTWATRRILTLLALRSVRRCRQRKVELDVAMAKDEDVYVGVCLQVFLGIEHQMLAILTHIGGLFAVSTLQS